MIYAIDARARNGLYRLRIRRPEVRILVGALVQASETSEELDGRWLNGPKQQSVNVRDLPHSEAGFSGVR